jgi:hypothetical protein
VENHLETDFIEEIAKHPVAISSRRPGSRSTHGED